MLIAANWVLSPMVVTAAVAGAISYILTRNQQRDRLTRLGPHLVDHIVVHDPSGLVDVISGEQGWNTHGAASDQVNHELVIGGTTVGSITIDIDAAAGSATITGRSLSDTNVDAIITREIRRVEKILRGVS